MNDLQPLLTPWTIGSASTGLILSLALLLALYRARVLLLSWLAQVIRALASQVGFFYVVIVVFLVISVLESGAFFNDNITHHAIFGLLGYALALGFDLVAMVCMQARLAATRMQDRQGSRLNLLGVCLCAAISAFANACGSLQGYRASNLDHTPAWMQAVAPWTGMVFPALIVILSMTTDHLMDHRAPAKGLDLDTYRQQEHKRVELLQIRLDTEKHLLTLEQELSILRRTREQALRGEPYRWFWTRGPRPTEQTRALHERLDALQVAVDTLTTRAHERDNAVAQPSRASSQGAERSTMQERGAQASQGGQCRDAVQHQQMDTTAVQQEAVRDAPGTTGQGQVDAFAVQYGGDAPGTAQEQVNTSAVQESALVGNTGEQMDRASSVKTAILLALHQSPTISDRQLARQIQCSPTTVARWRKHVQEQGVRKSERTTAETVEGEGTRLTTATETRLAPQAEGHAGEVL